MTVAMTLSPPLPVKPDKLHDPQLLIEKTRRATAGSRLHAGEGRRTLWISPAQLHFDGHTRAAARTIALAICRSTNRKYFGYLPSLASVAPHGPIVSGPS